MPRPSKIWFRKDVGWWMVTVGGEKVRLAQGKGSRELALQKFHELKAVQPQAPESATARVADVIEAFLAWTKIHRSPETNRNYLWYGQLFSEHSGYLRASELKPIHVTRWVDERGWKETTERNARRSVSRAFSWAAEEGILARNPLQGMKCPGANARGRILTDHEFRVLVRNSSTDFKLLLFVLRETGCRPKEARTLRWPEVFADRWEMKEHKTAKKTKRPRVVHLNATMRRLMEVLRRRAKDPDGHVFLSGRGKAWTANAVKLRVLRLKNKEELGLPKDLCTYLLRHAFGTNAIVNGVDIASVAELMGHRSTEMISRVYLHLADQRVHLKNAVEQATKRQVAPTTPKGAIDQRP